MSKETLHLLLRMNHDRLETQIALQCAPLLTGVKISNLLTVTSHRKQEAAGLFEGTAVGDNTFLCRFRQRRGQVSR